MFHASWEVAVTAQPGKTTHSAGIICDFAELFCSQGFIFQVFLYLFVIFLLTAVPSLNYDGNLNRRWASCLASSIQQGQG